MDDYLLNYFYHFIHIFVIIVATFGWTLAKLHKLQIAVIFSILLSWIGGGLFFGFGYCFLTDWHWQVRRRLGIVDDPHSYTKLIFDMISGEDTAPKLVDTLTVAGLLIGIMGCIWRNRSISKR